MAPPNTAAARSKSEEELDSDGRRARGERTRVRVLEALLALVEEGDYRPTAQEVAERANVALRTVYHHFEDVEALRAMALQLQLTRHQEILQTIDPALPLDDRITQVVRQRRKLFELISPIRRATLLDEHSSQEMSDGLRRSRSEWRTHLASAFSPELASRRQAQQEVLDALDVATSWQTWNELRVGMGRSAAAAERTTIFSLSQLLTPSGGSRSRR